MRKTKTTAAEVALNKSIIIQQITQTQREAVAAVKTAGGVVRKGDEDDI